MKFITKKKAASLVAAGALALGLGGAAFAYFTATGSGSGSGSTGSSTALTLTQTTTVSGLLPGGPSIALHGTATNSGNGNEFVGIVTPSFGSSTCGLTAADFTFTASANNNTDVNPNSTSGSLDFGSIAMNDTAVAQSQSCSFTIDYTL